MAQALHFHIGGAEIESAPVKLDRKKLYGWVDTVATSTAGVVCAAAQVDPDGGLVVPAGAVKPALLDEDGLWVERSELVPLDAEGRELPMLPSSFDAPIILDRKASMEEFLDHSWKSVYQLDSAELAAAVGGDIYAFPFNYRAGPVADEGFLLAADGAVFLFAGEKIAFEYIGIAEEGVLDEDAEQDAGQEEDDFDFGMM